MERDLGLGDKQGKNERKEGGREGGMLEGGMLGGRKEGMSPPSLPTSTFACRASDALRVAFSS